MKYEPVCRQRQVINDEDFAPPSVFYPNLTFIHIK
jgi:hypothetical protein